MILAPVLRGKNINNVMENSVESKKDLTNLLDLNDFIHEDDEQIDKLLEDETEKVEEADEALTEEPVAELIEREEPVEAEEIEEEYVDVHDNEEHTQELQEEESFSPSAETKEFTEEIHEFSNTVSNEKVSLESDPPYTLKIENLRFKEDADEIFSIVKEFEYVTKDNADILRTGLDAGGLLLTHLGEYAAIVLAHKLRKFPCNLTVELTREKKSDRVAEKITKGLSRRHMKQNFSHETIVEKEDVSMEEIILTTSSQIERYTIVKYVEIIGKHILVDHEVLKDLLPSEQSSAKYLLEEERAILDENSKIKRSMLEEAQFLTIEPCQKIYKDLTRDLRAEAFKLHAHAIVDIKFQILNIKDHCQVTCTGNVVMISRVL